ncbi:hypothetical protein MC885_011513, partial [Smutsia gigantea]
VWSQATSDEDRGSDSALPSNGVIHCWLSQEPRPELAHMKDEGGPALGAVLMLFVLVCQQLGSSAEADGWRGAPDARPHRPSGKPSQVQEGKDFLEDMPDESILCV